MTDRANSGEPLVKIRCKRHWTVKCSLHAIIQLLCVQQTFITGHFDKSSTIQSCTYKAHIISKEL